MRNLTQIRELIAKLHDEAEAITNLAAGEKRELAADETARIDAILGVGDKAGEISALKAEEARAVKIEAAMSESIARRQGAVSPANRQGLDAGGERPRFDVPHSVMRPANLVMGRQVMNLREQEAHAYSFGRFIMASVYGHQESAEWCKTNGYPIRNAVGEGWDSKAGVLVPIEHETSIIRLVNEYGAVASEFGMAPMAGDTKIVPKRAAGLTAYYVAEAQALTPSDLSYNKVQLTAKKLAVLGRYSSEINEDAAISIGNEYAIEAALAIANAQDSAGFIGDGTSTYGRMVGIKNALTTGSEYTAATGNTAFATLDMEDFLGMVALVQSYAIKLRNAKWYISRAGWAASMQRLAGAAGGNTVENIVNGVSQTTFMGYPVVHVEVMNSTLAAQTSTEGLCFFGDLRQTCLFGLRRGIAFGLSNDIYFLSDETAVKWTTRYDVNVHDVGVTSGASGGVVQLLTPSS